MIKKILSTLLFICASFCCSAQLTFARVDSIPVMDNSLLSNAWAGGFNFTMFATIDLNGDNILDLVAYEPGGVPGHSRIMPFLNGGKAGQIDYHFAPQYITRFPDIKGFLVTYDYNNDGKMDLFSLSAATNSGIMVYRNDYTVNSGLQFTKVKDPVLSKYAFGSFNVFASAVNVPAFSDIDNDGDMDIISFPPFPNGSLEYQRNLAVDSGWSKDSLRFKNITGCWGGFALEVGTANNRVASFGISCRQAADYPSLDWDKGIAANDDTQSIILVYDNDGDGDKEALIGGYGERNALLVVNGGSVVKDSMVSQIEHFPDYDVPVDMETFPYFFFIDVNNDGAKDLIVTPHGVNNFRGIVYYKNTGTTNNPHFVLQPKTFLQEDMIEVGVAAVPRLFDYDGDGLNDLLIGNESYHDTDGSDHKGLTLYKNTGTATDPKFDLITRDYLNIDALNGIYGTIHPTFGDLDSDGDKDLVIGYQDGKLLYYENTAGPNNPATFNTLVTNYQGIDVGQFSTPQLYDLNRDGMLDLVIGNMAGIIKYYQNTGTPFAPVFSLRKDTLGGIIVKYPGFSTGYANPYIYNDKNVDKLVVGTESGKLYVYDNINGNILGKYTLSDSLSNGEEGQRLAPCLADLNQDGHPDMLVGNYNGGVSLYMNTDTLLSVGTIHTAAEIRPSFTASPNPASDKINLAFYNFENTRSSIEMVNSIGQVVLLKKVSDPKMEIAADSYAGGVYLIRFLSDDYVQSQKVIISRK